MKKLLNYTMIIFMLIFCANSKLYAQKKLNIHQQENTKYKKYEFKTEKEWDVFNNYHPINKKTKPKAGTNSLSHTVFGWNPYWMGTAYKDFDYSLLSDVSYFSYEVDPNTGLPSDMHYWLTTELVDYAHNNNCKVSLTVTIFKGHATLFANSTSQKTLIDTIVGLLKYRNADGVNLDIEAVPSSQSTQLTAFVKNFSTGVRNELPNAQISIDLPAVNWNDKFNVAAMVNYIDLFLIMGYDYYWSGSEEAGPVSPKNNGNTWPAYDVTRSINYYIEKGIPTEKLALAVPYYGRDWTTNSSSVPSSTTGGSSSKTYQKVRDEYSNYAYHWDMSASVAYKTYQDGSVWHQCWYDDEFSLAAKYDLVKMKKLAGIGIWALGYDGAYPNLWNMLQEKFKTGEEKIAYGVFTDMGGPHGNYFNNEDYLFTIAPQNATEIKLVFDEFSTQANSDVLKIYDGTDTTGNLLGSFSGNNTINDTLTANSGAMSFWFVSDNSNTSSGWYARWNTQDYVLGINEQKLFNIQKFMLFPNPVQNTLSANLSVLHQEELKVKIFSLRGSLINQEKINVKAGNNRINLSSLVQNLQTGNYLISIISENYRITKKIFKN